LKDPCQANPGTVLMYHKDIGSDVDIPEHQENTKQSSLVLYASVHLEEKDGFKDLCDAIDCLALNDKGLESGTNSSKGSGPFLGPA
jgi:hypothetical protein